MVLLGNKDMEYTFIDEPWIVDAFWECQSQMPPDAKLLAFILYANKMKLSSFGHEKGYPVIACLANLPIAIRNGKGLGGGQVVGWLPLIKDDPKHKDYEEHFMYKGYNNAFHDMNHKTTNVHRILSHDHLHVNILSFFRDHMWSKLQLLIGLLGHDKIAQVDENFDALPHWWNLIHFDAIMAITFTDGSKYKVIFKSYMSFNQLLAFAAHAVLPNAGESKLTYLLPWCICAYLKVDWYAALEVHTTKTIAAEQEALQDFSRLMDAS
ncbi:hypothetical protein BDR06DRAFT_975916 [Suillus hirtellus]|nr:hypothetical protein BDR06DRAFT_975916 [Suillus hirtellus]